MSGKSPKISRKVFAEENVPENIKIGENVEEIGRAAFSNCQSLKSIELNDKITEIAPRTFENCKNLETVTGGRNVETIGEKAFSDAWALKVLDFPALKSIEEDAFESCQLENITIPECIDYVEEDIRADNITFCINADQIEQKAEEEVYQKYFGNTVNHAQIINIVFTGHSLKPLDDYDGVLQTLFGGFGDWQEVNITFDNSITEIGDSVFSRLHALKKISLPENLQSIGDEAFEDCAGLKEIHIPASVTKIGEYAFCGCTALEEITLPESLRSVGDWTFYECTSLKKSVLSPNLEYLPEMIFDGCTSLEEVIIPDSVKKIGLLFQYFWGCMYRLKIRRF